MIADQVRLCLVHPDALRVPYFDRAEVGLTSSVKVIVTAAGGVTNSLPTLGLADCKKACAKAGDATQSIAGKSR